MAFMKYCPWCRHKVRKPWKLAGSRLNRDDDILIVAETSRSQLDNRQACLAKLKALVVDATNVPKPRKKTRPSRGQIEKRLDQKRRRADRKQARAVASPGSR